MQNILRHFYSFPLSPFTFLLTSAILHPKVVPRSFVGRSKGQKKGIKLYILPLTGGIKGGLKQPRSRVIAA